MNKGLNANASIEVLNRSALIQGESGGLRKQYESMPDLKGLQPNAEANISRTSKFSLNNKLKSNAFSQRPDRKDLVKVGSNIIINRDKRPNFVDYNIKTEAP